MKFINPIYLIETELKQDKIGGWINTDKKRKVLVDFSSISLSEFYNAKIAGMKPVLKFNIRKFEYKGEKSLMYLDTKYVITRTYPKDDGVIEIVCSEFVGEKNE